MFDSVEQNLDRRLAVLRSARRAARVPRLARALDGVHVDLDWPEAQKRALIKRAVDLYRIRGTRRGLALFLKLFTGHEPDIEENTWPFKGFRVEGEGAEKALASRSTR